MKKEEEKSIVLAEKQEMVVIEMPEQESSFNEIITTAIGKEGFSADLLEKCYEVYEKNEAHQAKKAFTLALANFKANVPLIEKDKYVYFELKEGAPVSYWHSTLGATLATVGPILSNFGLSLTFATEHKEAKIEVTAILTHMLGHSETTSMMSAQDPNILGNNKAMASTVTYLQRYLTFLILGLASIDVEDDDGKLGDDQTGLISKEDLGKITDVINSSKRDNKEVSSELLEYLASKNLSISSLNEIPQGDWVPYTLNAVEKIANKKPRVE